MYMTEKTLKDFSRLFSQKEIENIRLWDKISLPNLMKLLKNSRITDASVDYNSYGEFMFVHFAYRESHYFVYGLGLHEYRKTIYKDFFKIEGDNACERAKTISFKDATAQIAQRLEAVKLMKEPKQDEESYMFNELADVGDEDGAMSMLY